MAKKALAVVTEEAEVGDATAGAERDYRARLRVRRESRHARRGEIQARWNSRFALRQFERQDPNFEPDPFRLQQIMYYGQYAAYGDLLDIWGGDTRHLAVYLLRVLALKEMPYDEYLQTEEWKLRAKQAKHRYNGQCALDAGHDAVDTHHRTYERKGRELPDDLIPLCRECHTLFHKR